MILYTLDSDVLPLKVSLSASGDLHIADNAQTIQMSFSSRCAGRPLRPAATSRTHPDLSVRD